MRCAVLTQRTCGLQIRTTTQNLQHVMKRVAGHVSYRPTLLQPVSGTDTAYLGMVGPTASLTRTSLLRCYTSSGTDLA